MEIDELIKKYQLRFEEWLDSLEGKEKLPPPSYVPEVITPVMKMLADAMPEFDVKVPNPKTYTMLKGYYRIKIGLTTIGGLSYPTAEDHKLYFTPMFHAKPIAERVEIVSISQFTEIAKSIMIKQKHSNLCNSKVK